MGSSKVKVEPKQEAIPSPGTDVILPCQEQGQGPAPALMPATTPATSVPPAAPHRPNRTLAGGGGAAGRARIMRTMQGSAGNTRGSDLLNNPVQTHLTRGAPGARYEQ